MTPEQARLPATLCLAAALLALSACGGDDTPVESPAPPPVSGTPPSPPPPPPPAPAPEPPPAPAPAPEPPPPPPPSPPPPPPPPAPAPPSSGPGGGTGAVTTGGSLSSSLAAVPTFTPNGNDTDGGGYKVGVFRLTGETVTFFSRQAGAGGVQQALQVSTRGAQLLGLTLLTTRFDGVPRTTGRNCSNVSGSNPCTGASVERAADGSFTLRLVATPLAFSSILTSDSAAVREGTTLDGSLTGRLDGAYNVMAELPASVSGSASVDGEAATPGFGIVSFNATATVGAAATRSFPTVQLRLVRGDAVVGDLFVSRIPDGAGGSAVRLGWAPRGALLQSAVGTAAMLTETATGWRVELSNAELTARNEPTVRVSAAVEVLKPMGRLTDGNGFALDALTLLQSSDNQRLSWDVIGLQGPGVAVRPQLQLLFSNRQLVRALWVSPAGSFSCDSSALESPSNVACGSAFSFSDDRRTVTLSGLVLRGVTLGGVQNLSLNGSVSGPNP